MKKNNFVNCPVGASSSERSLGRCVGILLKAKELGLVNSIREDLEHLREKGFSISQSVIDAVLEQAQER